MSKPLRWAIVSCGLISSDFVIVLQNLSPDDHVVVGCAARSLESAKEFADKFGIAKYFDQYLALAQLSEVDVVYIGSINSTHYDLVKMFLNAGKAVLCEKPLCMNFQHTEELIAIAKEKKLFFMEGMWARCNPLYKELKKRVRNGEVGEVTHASVSFGVLIDEVARVSQKSLGGGVTPDIGIYALNFILMVMGDEMPVELKAFGKLNDEGVDCEVTVVMKFSRDRLASFALSSSTKLPNEATVSGTKGTFKLHPPFWSPTLLSGPSGDISNPLNDNPEKYNFPNSEFLKYEAEEVARCLEQGLTECPLVPLSLTLKFSKLITQIRAEVGVED